MRDKSRLYQSRFDNFLEKDPTISAVTDYVVKDKDLGKDSISEDDGFGVELLEEVCWKKPASAKE